MSRTKDKECPVCGEMFSSQGLAGHLQRGHGLEGEGLKEAYRKVVPPGGDKYVSKVEDIETGSEGSPVFEALRRITLLKQMKREANEERYREEGLLERDMFEGLSNFLDGNGNPFKRVRNALKEKIEAQLEEAREDYKRAIAKAVESDAEG